MPDQDGGARASGGNGLSRRRLLQVGGGGVVAVAVGVGVPAGAADAAHAAPPGSSAARPLGPLHAVDPHAFTARSAPEAAAIEGAPRVRILPIARAKLQARTYFDLRIEASGVDPETVEIFVFVRNASGPVAVLEGAPQRYSPEPRSLVVTYPHQTYPRAGTYVVHATVRSGGEAVRAEVVHEVVVATSDGRAAKNVIFFLGDGMGSAAITAARILSKGIAEGKYHGLLELDQMEYRGLVGTSGCDSIATDSANSMSAYMTGHKSSVNAMGVYEGNDPDPRKHPWVETIAELLKRSRGMSIGVVTTAEIQDATPAAVWAHTRRRSEYIDIMDQALRPSQVPDVLMGGGRASLLPRSVKGSRRTDDRDLRQEFMARGFVYAESRTQLRALTSGAVPPRLLGLFHDGNMNVYLDRQHAKDTAVLGQWTDQPNLMEMTAAALKVLGTNTNGFFLMVEGASIDKMEHPLDGPRVAYDTIEMDQALGVAKRWARGRDDTLIVVTADHNHSMSIVGTHDRRGAEGRAGNGVYADAGFPTYADTDGDGFPDDPNPDRQLFFGWSNHPDYTDDFVHNTTFLQPALLSGGKAVPNPSYDPGADLQTGNLPVTQTNCVHTVEDVPIFASGPGASLFNRFLDNTEVFHAIMSALQLRPSGTSVDPRLPAKVSVEAVAEEPVR